MRTRTALLPLAVVSLLAVAACGGTAAGSSRPEAATAAAEPTTAEVEALFDTWNRALATGDAETVAALYAPDAVLLPTLSAQVMDSPEEIRDYFEDTFLPNEPQGVVTESVVHVQDEDSAVRSGLYDFTVADAGTGGTTTVPARFTFVYGEVDGEWLILAHHSSVQPATKDG